MKIYTKTGDDGSTGLIGGERVRKSDRRIDCFGTIDELNAMLGWASVVAADELLGSLRQIQNDLFVIGSHLALPEHDAPKNQWLPSLDESMITRLEMQIDTSEQRLPATSRTSSCPAEWNWRRDCIWRARLAGVRNDCSSRLRWIDRCRR